MAVGSSPTAQRRELGSLLRRHRETAGLAVKDVAERLLCSPTKISRLETGHRAASLRDVRDLCIVYGLGRDEQDRLMEMARQSRQRGWWEDLDIDYSAYIGLEAAAQRMSNYESALVPGLLQTEEYAHAVIKGVDPSSPEDKARRVLEARLKRQELLTRADPPSFWAVLDEAALRRNIGGPDVMRVQIQRIIQRSELPNVTVQVIPFEVGPHPGLNSTFIVLDFDNPALSSVVFVEGLIGNLYLERAADLSRYKKAFDALTRVALGPADSMRFMASIDTTTS